MDQEIREMIAKYKRLQLELDEAGGPGKSGGLFEELIGLEQEILAAAGLPPAKSFISLLYGDEVDEILKALETSAKEYGERPIKDPALLLVNAAIQKEGDPFDLLPMAGLTTHDYQLFMFEKKLLDESSIEAIDAILAEMRAAETHLGDLGIIGIQGVRKNPDLYRTLRDAGMHNLDEYLMRNDVFDLDEGEMEPRQFCLRGLVNADRERFTEAVADFTRAAEHMKDFHALYFNRGLARDMMELHDEALEDYSRAIQCNPGDYRSLCNRGMLFVRKGMMERALEDFERAVEVNPQSHFARCNRGNAYEALGEHERAVEDFTAAIALAPGQAYLYCNRGMSFLRTGKRDRALEDLKKAAEMGNEDAGEALKQFFEEESDAPEGGSGH